MNRLHQVSDALMEILKDLVPELSWQEKVIGLQIPKSLQGSFTCAGVSFKRLDKGVTQCLADYVLYIIDPTINKTDPRNVESLAFRVRDVLSKNNTLDEWATDSHVTKITFATAGGRDDVGAAVIEYTVDFEIEED